MRVGAFELYEPLPDLREPYAFVMLSPWIDIGRVGTMALSALEAHFEAQEMGKLRRPGLFFDFTRYRPMMYRVEGRREVKIPNTFINYAKREEGNDLLFFHCLEPHMLGETYAESILKVLEKVKAKRYCTLGSMYDSVPHTRPLIVSGSASDEDMAGKLRALDVNPSGYQGPTSILTSQGASKSGLQTLTLIVHLPHYTQLEEDFSGQYTLLKLISSLYQLPIDLGQIKSKGEEQYQEISLAVANNSQIEKIVQSMEMSYDTRPAEGPEADIASRLSPEVERFLREINKRFDSNK